jgi:hypothetical protein
MEDKNMMQTLRPRNTEEEKIRNILSSKTEVFRDHTIEPDHRDHAIAELRINEWNKDKAPRVGDYVIMPDGTIERFSYRWDEGIQTCKSGSFYLGTGYASMSGGLNPSIPNEKIQKTDEKKIGIFWFFHHDYATAYASVGVRAECRVYRVI